MSLINLGSLAIRLSNKNLLRQSVFIGGSKSSPTWKKHRSTLSSKNQDEDDDLDKPIPFLNSPAAKWDAVASRRGPGFDDAPWFQGYVVLASVAAVLIYFCILREENDIDEKLTLKLEDHFEGEKKKKLIESQRAYIEWSDKLRSKEADLQKK